MTPTNLKKVEIRMKYSYFVRQTGLKSLTGACRLPMPVLDLPEDKVWICSLEDLNQMTVIL